MFHTSVTLLPLTNTENKKVVEVDIFVRHFNREVLSLQKQVVNPTTGETEDIWIPLYYNKEENDFRYEMCTEVVLDIDYINRQFYGEAITHKNDHKKFSKPFGRKLAMGRALASLRRSYELSKEDRRKIWDFVLNTHQPVKMIYG